MSNHDNSDYEKLLAEFVLLSSSDSSKFLPVGFADQFEVDNNVTKILNGQNEDILNLKVKENNIIADLFKGVLEIITTCVNCNSSSKKFQSFWTLPLPMNTADSVTEKNLVMNINPDTNQIESDYQSLTIFNRSFLFFYELFKYYYNYSREVYAWISNIMPNFTIDLEACLKAFFHEETLTKTNQYKCDLCKKYCNAKREIKIFRPPQILILHLNRFHHTNSLVKKITNHVDFPFYDLSLEQYLSDNDDCQANYDLIAIICHHGDSAQSGHYTCFAIEETMDWYHFDDMKVYFVTHEYLLARAFSAYVLFYQRNDSYVFTSKALEVAIDLERHWFNLDFNQFIPKNATELANYYYFFSMPECPDLKNLQFVNKKCFYISRKWSTLFTSHLNPGYISNEEIFCMHDKIRPTEYLFLNKLVYPVIEPVGRFLWLLFNGGPIFNSEPESICSVCLKMLDNFEIKRRYEGCMQDYLIHIETIQDCNVELTMNSNFNKASILNSNILDFIDDDSTLLYAISGSWIMKWLNFVSIRTNKEYRQTYRQLFDLHSKFRNAFNQRKNLAKRSDIDSPKQLMDKFYPPISLLVKCVREMNTEFSGKDSDILTQVDQDVHTILPPDLIDNWSLFDLMTKMDDILEKESLNSIKMIANKSIQLAKETEEKLSESILLNIKYKYIYDMPNDHSKQIYLIPEWFWEYLKKTYNITPSISYNVETETAKVEITPSDLNYFEQVHYSKNKKLITCGANRS